MPPCCLLAAYTNGNPELLVREANGQRLTVSSHHSLAKTAHCELEETGAVVRFAGPATGVCASPFSGARADDLASQTGCRLRASVSFPLTWPLSMEGALRGWPGL